MPLANDKIFYEQEETCPVCEKKFTVRKVRRSMCMVSKRDTDFCVTYQNVNPNLYSIWVCPHCGYAASDAAFAEVSPGDQQKLAKGLAEMGYAGIDFSGERDVKKAVAAYERAVRCAEIRGSKSSVFASLYLRTAWLYRAEHDPNEAEFVQKSLTAYETAFNSEPMPIGKMSEVAVSYLVGELYRRTGNPAKAVQWFSQVVSNPKARMEPQMLQLARDGWQESRDAAKKQPAAEPKVEGQPAAEEPPAAKPAVTFVTTQPAQASPPLVPSGPKMRAKVVSVLTIYADQSEWLKKVSAATRVGKKRLDPQAIVRALLDSVIHVEPKLLKGHTEEEMLGLFKAVQTARPEAQPGAAARGGAKVGLQPREAGKAAGGTA